MFVGIILALLLASATAGTLQQVLTDQVQHYGNVTELKQQLQLILDESRALLKSHAAAKLQPRRFLMEELQQRRFLLEEADFNFEEFHSSVLKSLEVLESVADEHPVLLILSRRAYLASVALHCTLMGQNVLSGALEQKLADVVAEFYRIHVMSVVRKGLLEYLHISKSGGTSFSAAAKHSNCSMARGIGQLESLGDIPRWINGSAFEEITGGTEIMWSFYSTSGRPAKGRDCSRRLSHLSAEGYSYVSNEFTLHGGSSDMRRTHICPQAVNVVTMRNPDSRLASHLHYMLARFKKRIRGKHGADPEAFEIFCSGTQRVWDRVAPTVVDNYGVRSFVGEREFHAPVGSIGEEHLEVARRLLLQFDLVMDLDAGEAAADLVLRQGLGWNVSMAQVHVRSSSQTFSKLNYSKEECPNDRLLRKLLPRQEPDRQLYSTGRTLAMLDTVFLAVAKAVGLDPEAIAEAFLSGAGAKASAGGRAGTADSARWSSERVGAPTCGLLRTAAGWQPLPDPAAEAAVDAIAATGSAAAESPREVSERGGERRDRSAREGGRSTREGARGPPRRPRSSDAARRAAAGDGRRKRVR